ncbi:HAD family hydrolase [Dongia soli]|uniref:HAD family hydrolase n=1 Tax=Dongia soli TaxID=600628 RepID=A0ABU5EGU0_9PROT|nr:HAD family hydrolase [Dongia soli]MDY0885084.1 HAD family hydrolase [Dongia soli]
MAAILLDLDGTLTDPQIGITRSIRHALEALKLPVPSEQALISFIGPPLLEAFHDLVGDATLAQRCVDHYRDRFGTIGLYENEVFPGVPEMLDQLLAVGHRLYLATSKPHVFASRILDHFGLTSRFAAIYGSELDGTRTRKADLIAHLLAKEGIGGEPAVMIGDREHDVHGASANNLPAIGVLYGYGSRAELEAAGATAFVASPAEIPAIAGMMLRDRVEFSALA